MKKIRADQLTVERGLAETRSQARALIMAGQVLTMSGGIVRSRVEKAGQMLAIETELVLKDKGVRFASRGGLKLDGALEDLKMDVRGLRVLDVGASTGGFTDCLLKRGADHVTAIDVGYGQLHWRLREDPRVRIMERTNARFLEPDRFEELFDLAVIDVSFISLSLILPSIKTLIKTGGNILALVKPQFEAGREKVGKGGVVRDTKIQLEAVESVAAVSRGLGFEVRDRLPARIKGPKGNQEYFLLLTLPL
ncbi:MAG: TlyA family RNA methyltransferase [Deltaproteobacteria bacterium]|nr:TlyA family RNA methyltransferase [Deltaproteobacteria bacterium]MBW2051542.1 TlyA family RNA methyltransferase [Deltaproteobacteria bacterium]MBW2140107.1 TlyA family RNA methyltransferase [Deltaproteobacteria bacterium]MBW2322032.1 TlyA family RNA methyltransferase [Deltaproteobacteria bacterium]